MINIGDYRDKMSQYRIDRDAAEKTVKEIRVYSALRPEIVFPPEPLEHLRQRNQRPGRKPGEDLARGKAPAGRGETAAGDNPFLASFFSVDFVDIAAIIFSLLALLFSYDAFTREKRGAR